MFLHTKLHQSTCMLVFSPFSAPKVFFSNKHYVHVHVCYGFGPIFVGIVFDLSDQLNIKFTLRLRHEVGERDSWLTRMTSPNFEAPGPRISDKYVGVWHVGDVVRCIDLLMQTLNGRVVNRPFTIMM